MINVHNTFDPLKEIIIGDVDLDAIKLEDPRQQKRIEYIFQKTKEELNNFQSVLQSRGITVHRPTPDTILVNARNKDTSDTERSLSDTREHNNRVCHV